jgi:hypothetical protein
MSGSGWGSEPWGSSFGSSSSADPTVPLILPTTPVWTKYAGDALTVSQFLSYQDVSAIGNGSQFFYGSLEMVSGGAEPHTAALLTVLRQTPGQFTIEWWFEFKQPLPSRTDETLDHVYLGCADAAGPVFGLLLTNIGLVYTGSVHFDISGNINYDFPRVLLPDTDALIQPNVPMVIRAVVDGGQGRTYIYCTKQSDALTYGHQLVEILPTLYAADAAFPPIEGSAIAVRGSTNKQHFSLLEYNLSDRLLIPNQPPIAVPGSDQAVRTCSILQLDGSASFDPEGAELLQYVWRLVDAPDGSQYVSSANDGYTLPDPAPTGYTKTFYSTELGVLDAVTPIVPGDVLLVGSVPFDIASKQASPFAVVLTRKQLVDNLSAVNFKLLRQTGITTSGSTDDVTPAKPTFYPDKPGFYSFDLAVFDGALWSTPDGLDRPTTLVNVANSDIAQGVVPEVDHLWSYLSDFWKLVEDKEPITTIWSGIAQVTAAELFTLWQYEYSKSHRDIPRYFNRKWLHYDLLLGEPMPNLTEVSPLNCYVDSEVVGSTVTGIDGTTLVVNCTLFDKALSVPMQVTEPFSTALLASSLDIRLKQKNADFSCTLVQVGASTWTVRIAGPAPFSISLLSTCSLFAPGTKAAMPTGNCQVLNSTLVLLTDTRLNNLGIKEDDLFVIGDNASRIARVQYNVDYTTTVVLKDAANFIDGTPTQQFSITGHLFSRFLNFYLGLLTTDDYVDLEVTLPGAEPYLETVSAVAACAGQPQWLSLDLLPVQAALYRGATVYLARMTRCRYLPVDPALHELPTLQENIVETDDSKFIHENVDYYITTHRGVPCLKFAASNGFSPFEGERPPARLWAEFTYIDNAEVIEDNFGRPVGLLRDELVRSNTEVDYLSAVRGMWHAYYNPPTLYNLRVGIQILLGLPFAERAGTIQEIRTDFFGTQTRVLIKDSDSDIVRSYTFNKLLPLEVNPANGARYVVGDSIAEFAPIATGASVVDYIKDPTWWLGYVDQGSMSELEKYHRFVVRVDSRVFNISAIGLASRFLYKMRPQPERYFFLVQLDVSSITDEISVDDDQSYTVTLTLDTSIPSTNKSQSYIFDQPNQAGGGWMNQFDYNGDVQPVYPTPTTPVKWGFDKAWLSPEQTVYVDVVDPVKAGTFKYNHVLSGTATSFTILSGTVPVGVEVDTTFVKTALLGIVVPDAFTYRLALVSGATELQFVDFTADTNLLFEEDWDLTGLLPGDPFTLVLRRTDNSSFTAPWASTRGILVWSFDPGHVSDTYYNRTQVL